MVITMFNNNLKSCREDLEITQTQLGYIFGVSKQTVSGWENAKDTMPFNKLIKFSNLYDYSLDYILGFTRKNINYNVLCNENIIGNNLKKLRNDFKLSQKQIADVCNICQTTYSGYETGKYLINTMTVYAICKKYHVSADWIVGKSNIMYIKNEKN